MNENLKCSKTNPIFVLPNEKFAVSKCLQPLRIILLTTSKETKYTVSIKPRKLKAKDNISLHSANRTNEISNETSDHEENHIFAANFVPRLSSFDESTQRRETSLSDLRTKQYDKVLERYPAANVFRLTGGWGHERLAKIKKRNRSKQNSKTENKRVQNEHKKNEGETFEAMEDELVLEHSIGLSEHLGKEEHHQSEKPSNKNVKIDNLSLLNDSDTQHNANFEHGGYQNRANEALFYEKPTKTPAECITSSFVADLIKETCPALCDQSYLKHSILIAGDAEALQLQHKKTTDNKLLSDLVCSDEETRKRIDHLEDQVSKLNFELGNLQATSISLNDLENFSGLTKNLSEITILLAELRVNCSELQNIEFQMKQEIKPDDREVIEMVSPNYLPKAMNSSSENYKYQYLKTCNCGNYKEPRVAFANSNWLDAAENCSDICNCINYSHKYCERSQQTEPRDVINNNLAHGNGVHLTRDMPRQRYGKSENSYLLSHPKFSSSPAQAVTDCRGNTTNSRCWHFEWPSARANGNYNKVTTSATDDGFLTDSPLPETISSSSGELPLTTHNIRQILWRIIGDMKPDEIVLTVYVESNNLYYITVSILRTGQFLGYIYTNKMTFKKAKAKKIFDKFLVLLVLNSQHSSQH